MTTTVNKMLNLRLDGDNYMPSIFDLLRDIGADLLSASAADGVTRERFVEIAKEHINNPVVQAYAAYQVSQHNLLNAGNPAAQKISANDTHIIKRIKEIARNLIKINLVNK
jgi:hypothetical protein